MMLMLALSPSLAFQPAANPIPNKNVLFGLTQISATGAPTGAPTTCTPMEPTCQGNAPGEPIAGCVNGVCQAKSPGLSCWECKNLKFRDGFEAFAIDPQGAPKECTNNEDCTTCCWDNTVRWMNNSFGDYDRGQMSGACQCA